MRFRFPISSLLLAMTVLSLSSSCSVFGIRSGYEQLDYSVIETFESVEVRQYPKRVAAEVNDLKDDRESFMLLFGYISGKNSSNQNVAMTAPVEVDKSSVQIEMTAPVEASRSSDRAGRMRFFLPRSFKADSAPTPNDSRIKIVDLPEQTLAAITYSGSNSEKRFSLESNRLVKALAASKWKPVSEAYFLGYDPPFTIPFLRRNEVVVQVEPK